MQAPEQPTWMLVQPTARRREWLLRRGSDGLAVLRIPTFGSGAQIEIGNRRLQIRRLRELRGALLACYRLTRRNDEAAAAAGSTAAVTAGA